VPARPAETSTRRALILETVRSSPAPLNANTIATTVGGRKAVVLDEVRALVREGMLVPVEGGMFVARRAREEMITVDEAARRLSICVGSIKRLIEEGTLPGSQVMQSAPWRIPVAALETEPVRQGVQRVMKRRPPKSARMKDNETLRLAGA
jgi:excisionase family DNA binding protein